LFASVSQMIFRQLDADEDNKVNTLCIHLDARFETPCLWPPFHATFLARFFYVRSDLRELGSLKGDGICVAVLKIR
jgi:hypothetical protein